MDRCGNQNAHQTDMCLKEIGLHVQNLLIVLGLYIYIYIFGGGGRKVYDHLIRMRIFTLMMNKVII